MSTYRLVEAVQESLSMRARNAMSSVHPVEVDYALPESFRPSQHRGLICCQLTCNDEKARLILLWSSQEMYETFHAKVECVLDIEEASYSGAQTDARYRKPPVWLRNSIFSIIFGVLAFLTAVSDLSGWVSDTISEPKYDAFSAIAEGQSVKVLEGERVRLPINISNKMTTPHTGLIVTVLDDVLIESVSPANVRTDISAHLEAVHMPTVLSMGESKVMELSFSVPGTNALLPSASESLPVVGLSPIVHLDILAELVGKAGFLGGKSKQKVRFEVDVWPKRGYEIKSINAGSDRAVVYGEFFLGRRSNRGVPFGVVLNGGENLRLESVQARDVSGPIQSEGNEIARRLEIPMQTEDYRTIQFSIVVTGSSSESVSLTDAIHEYLRIVI